MATDKHRRASNTRLVRGPNGSLISVQQTPPPEQKPLPKVPDLSTELGMSDDGTPLDKDGNPITKEKRFDWDETKELASEYFARFRRNQKQRIQKTKSKLAKKRKSDQPASGIATSTSNQEGVKRIEIAVSLPNTKKIKNRVKRLTKKQKRISLAAGVVLIAVVVGLNIFGNKSSEQDSSGVLGQSEKKSIPLNQQPEFSVLRPAGKKVEDLGGFARVSPQGAAAAYTYVDDISGTPIKVTQQEIPPKIKEKPVTELEKLAKDFNASKIVQIDDIAAYIGVAEEGPQTLIFLKDGLLVFIVANQEIPELQWVQYVSGLDK